MADAILSRAPVIPLVPADVGNVGASLVRVAGALNKVLRGGIGATMGVTLAPNATSSTFVDSRIGPYTFISLMPTTHNAATALPSVWIEASQGSATINHASSTNPDQTFIAVLLG